MEIPFHQCPAGRVLACVWTIPSMNKQQGAVTVSTYKRTRRHIPSFTGEIEGWTMNFLKVNLWRVARTMDRDDCMQEARCVFLRVADKYRDVNDPAHFMALYKTSWRRAFPDFSNMDTRVR